MCYALDNSPRPSRPINPIRRRRTIQITRLLQRSYHAQLKHATPAIFSALALKLERILYRAFPNEEDAFIPQDLLEEKMRQVIARILHSKEIVGIQPNNYTIDTYRN